ncbi:MAG: FtsQ-type POTRA domain-containing protein [Candidatus Nanopelagicales bacterium]|nr:FtsQ-type POTRA domain-containing protein [Candidatus Nanopelagicales bacterium]
MPQPARPASKQSTRKPKIPRVIWLILVIAVFVWWSLYLSKWFIAQEISVTGNERLTIEQISTLAEVPIGNSLMSIDTAAMAAQLMSMPEIEVATVERGWPHTILIKVTERTPIAVAATASGFNLIDSQGHNAGVVAAPPAGLLIISAQPDSNAMLGAIKTLAAIPAQWQLIGLSAPTQDSIVATLGSGAVITFGSSERAADKVEVAQALMEKGYSVINVSAPDAATVLK